MITLDPDLVAGIALIFVWGIGVPLLSLLWLWRWLGVLAWLVSSALSITAIAALVQLL